LHNTRNDDEEVEEEVAEGETSLDDAMLDEISDDVPVEEPEGFGHIKEDVTGEVAEEEEDAEEKTDAELEEDAEDVDYDSFDDEDHL